MNDIQYMIIVPVPTPNVFNSLGIGTMTWSPQAFGMYTGKFDEGVHLLSRGSIKVRVSIGALLNLLTNN